MNCEDANNIDMIDFLRSMGFQPNKIKGNNYWYLSPFRDEKEPSFKVERTKNVWYDHGAGKGGRLIDFEMKYYGCNVTDALEKIHSIHSGNTIKTNFDLSAPLHLHKTSKINTTTSTETAIKIIAVRQPILDLLLCIYLKQRRIEKNIADKHTFEVHFTNGENPKVYKAIGFRNTSGGYELRNEFFKGSSSPKSMTYLDNKEKAITVFEGFFDFLTYQSLYQNKLKGMPGNPSNFLILNSLSFFEKSLTLMKTYDSVHLYLDRDTAGRKYTEIAQNISARFKDESQLYRNHKDLNEWVMHFGKLEKKESKINLNRHI